MLKLNFINLKKNKLRIFITTLIILIAIPAAVYLVFQKASYKTKAFVDPVNIFFSPQTGTLPPDSNFSIMMDARSNNISFTRIVFAFDSTKVNIVGEIATSPLMNIVVEKTPTPEANSTGRAEIVLAVVPRETLPSGVFEIANFGLSAVSVAPNDIVQLAFSVNEIQVVDTSGEAVPSYTLTGAELILNPQLPTPTPISLPTNTPTPQPTATSTPAPTNTPTPVPATPTPTPAAGVTILLNSATGQTCRQVCASADPNRYMECRSVGTDSQALNNGAIIYSGSCITLTSGMSCDARMNNTGQICSGNRANWTRCRCE